MGRIFAGTLGLLAFVTMLVRGLANGSDPGGVTLYGAAAMFVFAGIGWMAGTIAQFTVAEAVQRQFDAEVTAREEEAETA